MGRKLYSIMLAAFVLTAGPALAAQARKKAEPAPPPPPPPQFHVDVTTRSIVLQQMKRSVMAEAKIGELQLGMLGCFGGEKAPIYFKYAFPQESNIPLQQAFAKEATAAGYKVPESEGNLFGGETKAELWVGAVIEELSEKACQVGFAMSSTTMSFDTTIKVDWQVYDPLEKKLLFRVTNEGTATLKEPYDNNSYRHLPNDAAVAAFAASAKAVLADPAFVAAVRDPKGGAPADPGLLFPDAKGGPSNEASGGANVHHQIAQLPLSKTPFKKQIEHLQSQVVTLRTLAGTGSGFYIGDGLLLTNQHVIDGSNKARIRFLGGREIDGEVIASNAKRDVALVRTESAGVSGLPLRVENPELAEQVFVIGSPRGEKNEGSVIAGIVSGFRTQEQGPFIQSDALVTHGNSGGPMFDAQGNVIGLVDLGTKDAGINLFIPIADALKVLEIGFAGGSPASAAKP